ncbi:MAG: hypothetical protein WDW38_007513 [Sanguina aurantia]
MLLIAAAAASAAPRRRAAARRERARCARARPRRARAHDARAARAAITRRIARAPNRRRRPRAIGVGDRTVMLDRPSTSIQFRIRHRPLSPRCLSCRRQSNERRRAPCAT